MNIRNSIIVAGLILTAGLGYWLGQQQSSANQSTGAATPMQSTAPAAERKVLYWYDPMSPTQHFDKPGKSPFMDMQLIPMYQQDAASIRIEPGVAQKLGIRTARVERGVLHSNWEAQGVVTFNQRDVAIVQARTNGFVTRVYRHAPGDVVRAEDPLVDELVPEWASAQTEYLALSASGDARLNEAARQRLISLGMSEQLIADIDRTRQVRNTMTIRTPRSGIITSLDVREGMTISSGSAIATINGLDTVWVEIAVPESQAALLKQSAQLKVFFLGYPGEQFSGKVIAVLPETNIESHTLRVRLELSNRACKLKSGMYAQVHLSDNENNPVLHVPSEAVIRTGMRNIVLLAGEDGRYTPVEVATGIEANGRTVILTGVAEGQLIVSSGQFLIDSEANLSGVIGPTKEPAQAKTGSESSAQGGAP